LHFFHISARIGHGISTEPRKEISKIEIQRPHNKNAFRKNKY